MCNGASVADFTGVTWYPPRSLISRTASVAATNDRTLAATRDSSYHWEARDLRWRRTASRTRAPQTRTSGTTASSSATRSAMMTQVSTMPAATGMYQRRGARSSMRKTSSSGSWVPRWSGWESSRCVALPNWGASMIPAATSRRISPSRPVARPLASRPAASTSSV